MAEQSSYRSTRAEPSFARSTESTPPDPNRALADPLAELARLIGQDDAFTSIGRDHPRRATHFEGPARAADDQAPSWLARNEEVADRRDRSRLAPRVSDDRPADHDTSLRIAPQHYRDATHDRDQHDDVVDHRD